MRANPTTIFLTLLRRLPFKRIGYFATMTMIAFSCMEDQNRISNPASSPEVLSFSTHEQFKNITSKISSMPQADFESWEKENSFKSYRSVLVDADREWALVDSEEKQTAFLAKYQDVLSIQDGSLIPHIKIMMYQSIINREGIYRTGDHFHKVVGDFIVSVKKEDYYTLSSVKLAYGEPMAMNGIRVLRYTGGSEKDLVNARTQVATCTNDQYYKEAEYFLGASKCKDGRKAYISARSFMSMFTGNGIFNGTDRYGDYSQSAVEMKLWAKKRNSFCGWNDYDTQLEWRRIEYTIVGYVITGYEANRTLSAPQSFIIALDNYDSGGDVGGYAKIFKFGAEQFNNTRGSWPFTKIYGEGKSRGVGDNWAVIFCP